MSWGKIYDTTWWGNTGESNGWGNIYPVSGGTSTLLDGLVSRYNFNESSGDLLDQTGSNDGTVVGATQTGTEYSFDGVNDYVTLTGYKGITGTAARSFSFWFKPDTNDVSEYIIAYGSDNGADHGKSFIILKRSTNLMLFTAYGSSLVEGSTTINSGYWYHCVITMEDGDNSDDLKIYVNGSRETETTTGSVAINTLSEIDFTLGKNIQSGQPSSFLDGSMDNLRIYNRAISAAEVTAIYTLEISDILTKELVAGYEMNNDWTDVLGVNNGTANGATFDASSKLGSHAGSFDGTNDYVSLDGLLSDPNELSVACWVNRTGAGGTRIIFSHRNGVNNLIQFTFSSTTDIRLQLRSSGTSLKTYFATVASMSNTWNHVAFTFDRTNDSYKVYLNGSEVASGSDVFTGDFTATKTTIGGTFSPGFSAGFAGLADNLHIWNRALTSDEISHLYNSGSGIEHPF